MLDIGSTPIGARLGDLEIAPGRGATALHLDSGLRNAQQFARLMLGKDAGDVVVDYDHLIHFVEPLLGEHADGGRTATHAHPLFLHAVYDRWFAGLNRNSSTFVNREFDRLSVTEIEQRLAGGITFVTAAAREM